MQNDLIAKFTAEVVAAAKPEIDEARKRFALQPDEFTRWGSKFIPEFRARLTLAALKSWLEKNAEGLQRQLDAESEPAVREIDRCLTETAGAIATARRLDDEKNRPPKPDDGQLQPPSRQELLDMRVRASDWSRARGGTVAERGPRRALRRTI